MYHKQKGCNCEICVKKREYCRNYMRKNAHSRKGCNCERCVRDRKTKLEYYQAKYKNDPLYKAKCLEYQRTYRLNHLEQIRDSKHRYNTSEERKAYMRAYMKNYNLDAEKYEKAKERMRQYAHRKWFEAKGE